VTRHALECEHKNRRIRENVGGRIELDARVLAGVRPGG